MKITAAPVSIKQEDHLNHLDHLDEVAGAAKAETVAAAVTFAPRPTHPMETNDTP